jgi:hypothetical protein
VGWVASDRLMPGLRPRIRARWVTPFERQAIAEPDAGAELSKRPQWPPALHPSVNPVVIPE